MEDNISTMQFQIGLPNTLTLCLVPAYCKYQQPIWMSLPAWWLPVNLKLHPLLQLKVALSFSLICSLLIFIITCKKTIHTYTHIHLMHLQTLPTDIFWDTSFSWFHNNFLQVSKKSKTFLDNAKVFRDDMSFSVIWAINTVIIPTANQSCNIYSPVLL